MIIFDTVYFCPTIVLQILEYDCLPSINCLNLAERLVFLEAKLKFLFQRGAVHSVHRLTAVAEAQPRRPVHDADRRQVRRHGHRRHRQGRVWILLQRPVPGYLSEPTGSQS